MVAVVTGADAIAANFHVLGKGTQVAGYTTGSPDIKWTAAMWAAFPDAIRIDQDAGASDHTADVLDVESGAATPGECAAWKKQAQAAFLNGTRPGQREPAIYCSASNVTAIVNALVAGGVQHCPLWVAHFGIGMNTALSMLNSSSGPFPIIGVQYANTPSEDLDVWLTSWVKNRSKTDPPKPAAPPGQWNDPGFWTWSECALIGSGLDGQLHVFVFDTAKGTWAKAE